MPSMHDMIDELNDIECPSYPPVDSGCNNLGGYGNNFGSYGNNFGCGFGSWIWILLILFYAGQGGNSGYGGNSGCCCTKPPSPFPRSYLGGTVLFLCFCPSLFSF